MLQNSTTKKKKKASSHAWSACDEASEPKDNEKRKKDQEYIDNKISLSRGEGFKIEKIVRHFQIPPFIFHYPLSFPMLVTCLST